MAQDKTRIQVVALVFLVAAAAVWGTRRWAEAPPGGRYHAAQLHLHGSLSEGLGTLRGHNAAARRVGVEVLWWTDHDWRIARHTHPTGFDFEAQRESLAIPRRNQPWKEKLDAVTVGWAPEVWGHRLVEHATRLTAALPERGRSLEVQARASSDAEEWGGSEVQMSATAGRFKVGLAAGVSLRLAVHPLTPPAEDAQAIVRLQLSRQLDGIAELWYVLGEAGPRRLERRAEGRVGIVPIGAPAGVWSVVTLPVTQDAIDLGLGGWDNSLSALRLGVRVRRGAAAAARFDDLRILTELAGNQVLARQRRMAAGLEEEFGLVNHVGSEISYSYHMGAYLPRIELPDFERYPGGMDPRQIVAWAHERGGLASYNHIFGTPIAIDPEAPPRLYHQGGPRAVDNRIFGADLLEVGYPQRVRPLRAHLEVWDQLSAARVFLTAIGSSDSHDQVDGWFDGNNFITWVWAASPSAEDLIEGLRRGRAFLGDPTRFHGTLDLETDDGVAMGRVVHTPRPYRQVRLRATALPAGTTLHWKVDGRDAGRLEPPAGDFETTLRVDTGRYRFVRAELWLGDRGLAFTNCLYFVPAAEDGDVPHRSVHDR